MGGSVPNWINSIAAPYQPQQFSNGEIMSQVKSGYGKDMADAYKAEVLNQLRNGSFKDANGVYQNVLNNQAMAKYNSLEGKTERIFSPILDVIDQARHAGQEGGA